MIGAAEQRKVPVVIEVQIVTVITSHTHVINTIHGVVLVSLKFNFDPLSFD